MARTHTIVHRLDGATEADIRLKVSIGELRIDAGNDRDALIAGTVVLPDEVDLEQRCEVRDGRADCVITEDGRRHFRLRNSGKEHRWNLRLNPAVPLSLRVNTGVGESRIDLSDVLVTDLDVSAGVGELTLTVPSRGETRAKISAGVGETNVRIPDGVGARVRITRGIGSSSVSSRFTKGTNAWTTADYETNPNRIDLRVSAGVGSVDVR
jgi:hypothetical protein